MSLIQQALKRQQDEAKGKVVLPPPHLGSTQLAVKPQAPVAKAPLSTPTPNIAPVARPEGEARPKFIHHAEPAPPAAPPPPVSALVSELAQQTPPPPAPPVEQAQHPANPPPARFESSSEEEAPSRLSGSNIALALIALLFIGYGGWKYWKKSQLAATGDTPPAAAPGATDTKQADAKNEGQPVVKHIGPLPDVKDIKDKVNAMQTAVAASQSQNADIEKGVEAPPPAPVPAPAPVAEVKPAPPPAPVVVTPPAPAAVWPEITINGVMPNAVAAKASAIINGNVIAVGESIDGITVLEVRERGVKAEYKGEQKFILIGRR